MTLNAELTDAVAGAVTTKWVAGPNVVTGLYGADGGEKLPLHRATLLIRNSSM